MLINPILTGAVSPSLIPAGDARDYTKWFKVEGKKPSATPGRGDLVFSGTSSNPGGTILTKNGNGPRNEISIDEDFRKSIKKVDESLSADVKVEFKGAYRSIIFQYHCESKETLLKLYVDTRAVVKDGKAVVNKNSSASPDGKASVYARFKDPLNPKEEITVDLGRIASGDKLNVKFTNKNGKFTLTVNGKAFTKDMSRLDKAGGDAYLKMGDYNQFLKYTSDDAEGMKVGKDVDKNGYALDKNGRRYNPVPPNSSKVTFSNWSYVRN